MASRANGAILRQFETLFNLGAVGELTDGQLLERFAVRGGEEGELAFAALVERHGPMVWRVCRSILRDPDDAQDAFQAAFLVLVQKARSLWVRDSLGPWLHRVAYRVAARARRDAARRLEHERRSAADRPASAPDDRRDGELAAMLHDEIERLPARCREPLILCDLQGLTHHAAARRLGWPLGTVKTRLARARELLRGRLGRRNGLPSGVLIAGPRLAAAFHDVSTAPPTLLVESTIRAATAVATGKAVALKVISAPVAVLLGEVLKAMFLTKLKIGSAILASTIAVAGLAGALTLSGDDGERGSGPGETAPTPQALMNTADSATLLKLLAEEAVAARDRYHRLSASRGRPAAPDPGFVPIVVPGRLPENPGEKEPPVDDPDLDQASKERWELDKRLGAIDRILIDESLARPDLYRIESDPEVFAAKKRAESMHALNGKGYASRSQLYAAILDLERARAKARRESARKPDRVRGHAVETPPPAAEPRESPEKTRSDAELSRVYERVEWARQMFEKGYLVHPAEARAGG